MTVSTLVQPPTRERRRRDTPAAPTVSPNVRLAEQEITAREQEENLLGVVLMWPAIWPEVALLKPNDFSWFPYIAVFEAMCQAAETKRPIDELTLAEIMRELGTFGKLTHLGGMDYFIKLKGAVFTADNIAYYVEHIAARAARKRIASAGGDCLEKLRSGEASAESFFAQISALESQHRFKPPMTPAQRARQLGEVMHRLPTNIATIDKGTRGGFPFGRVVVVGGAPGAGKTSLLTQLIWQWCRNDPKIFGLFAAYDQGAHPILVRIGQNERCDRDALERGYHADHADHLRWLTTALERTPNFQILDGGEELVTIEQASHQLSKAARGPGVLAIDSAQMANSVTIPTTGGRVDAPERLRLIMEASKRAAREHGHLVMISSEINRESFKNKDQSQNSEDLASFKGSSAIEYAADLAIVLKKVKGDGDYVDGTAPKSRIGAIEPFRLQVSHTMAMLNEVSKPTDSDGAPSPERIARDEAEERKRIDDVRDRIIKALAAARAPITAQNTLRRLAKAKTETFQEALAELKAEGILVKNKEGFSVISNTEI